jgi:hypothetical protein
MTHLTTDRSSLSRRQAPDCRHALHSAHAIRWHSTGFGGGSAEDIPNLPAMIVQLVKVLDQALAVAPHTYDHQQGVCLLLVDALHRDSKNAEHVRAAGGCEVLVRALRQHAEAKGAEAIELQLHIVHALALLATENQQTATRIMAADACRFVATLMRTRRDEYRFQQAGCTLLYIFIQHGASQDLIGDAGGCEALVSAVRAHPVQATLHDVVPRLLAQLTAGQHRRNQDRIGQAQGCEALIDILRHYMPGSAPSMPDTVYDALLNLTLMHDPNALCLSRSGLFEVLVRLLQAPCSNVLQETVCRIILNMTYKEPVIIQHASGAGVLPAMARILAASAGGGHKTTANLAGWAMAVVTNLILTHDGNCVHAWQLGLGSTLTAALETHVSVANVAQRGCKALATLTRYLDQSAQRRLDVSTVQTLAEAVRTHPSNAVLLYWAFRALSGALGTFPDTASADVRRCLRADDVGALVATAMRTHAASSDVQEAACFALFRMVVTADGDRLNVDGVQYVRQAGVAPLIQHALAAHPQADALQHVGSKIVAALDRVVTLTDAVSASHADEDRVVAEWAALDPVFQLAAMTQYASQPHMQARACAAWTLTLRGVADLNAWSWSDAVIDATVCAMRDHPRAERLQNEAAAVLLRLTAHSTLHAATAQRRVQRMCAAGGWEAVAAAAAAFPAARHVQELIAQLRARL